MINILNEDFMQIADTLIGSNVDMILTDPPYDFNVDTKNAYHYMFEKIIKPGGTIAVFCPPENQWQPTCDQWLFWIKPISTKNTSKSYSRFVEMIQVWGGDTWDSDRHWSQYTNVFTDLVDSKLHPYAKPLPMLERLIKNHTNVGDTVLDPFMGSGSTGKVCKYLNRNFFGTEVDYDTYKIAEDNIDGIL